MGRRMRILFTIPGIARFPYHASTLKCLAERGHDVRLWSIKGSRLPSDADHELRKFIAEFEGFVANTQNLTLISPSKREHAFESKGAEFVAATRIRLLRTMSRYLQRLPFENFYVQRWLSYMPQHWQERLTKPGWRQALAHPRIFAWLSRREADIAPAQAMCRWMASLAPDAVVATPADTRRSPEAFLLDAARALSIPSVVPVLSWDNLSTKGLLPGATSLVLAWNQAHRNEAVTIHDIAPERVVITGAPFFDKWRNPSNLLRERAEFMRSLGLDPLRPYLCWLGSSKNIAADESWLIRQVINEVRHYPGLEGMQFLVRPHPANSDWSQAFAQVKGVVVVPAKLAFTREMTSGLYNAVFHAICAIGINTSAMIDALVIGKACLSIKTDQYGDTHLGSAHFRHIVQADAMHIAEGVGELGARIAALAAGVDDYVELRNAFVRDFITPWGAGGNCASRAIELLIEGCPVGEIQGRLAQEFVARDIR